MGKKKKSGKKTDTGPKFEDNPVAQAHARAVEAALERQGLHGFKLEIAMAQAAIESAGFISPVSQDDNNYSGITWDSRYHYLSKYPKGRARGIGEAGNYVHFPTIDDWARVYVGSTIGSGVFLSSNRGDHGRPIDATDIPTFVERLAANSYFTSSKTDYYHNEVSWDKRLTKMGIVSHVAGSDTTAGQSAAYDSILNTPPAGAGRSKHKGSKKKTTPAPAIQPPPYAIKPLMGPVPMHFDASYLRRAAKAAGNLMPGSGIAKELTDMANKATPFSKAGKTTQHPSANPEYSMVFTTPGYVPYSKNDDGGSNRPPPINPAAKHHQSLSGGPSLYQLQHSIGKQQGNLMAPNYGSMNSLRGNSYRDSSILAPGKAWFNPAITPLLRNMGAKSDTTNPVKAGGAMGAPDSTNSDSSKMINVHFRNFTENFTVQAGSLDNGAQETYRMFEQWFLQLVRSIPG